MLELCKNNRKIYVNPKYIASLRELEDGTAIILSCGEKLQVEEQILDIIYEIQALTGSLNLEDLLGRGN